MLLGPDACSEESRGAQRCPGWDSNFCIPMFRVWIFKPLVRTWVMESGSWPTRMLRGFAVSSGFFSFFPPEQHCLVPCIEHLLSARPCAQFSALRGGCDGEGQGMLFRELIRSSQPWLSTRTNGALLKNAAECHPRPTRSGFWKAGHSVFFKTSYLQHNIRLTEQLWE